MTETRSVDVFDGAGKKTGAVELPAEVFDLELNSSLLHQVINAQLAAARQGSIRAPQWTGGGIVHGPQPRDYSQKTPKKMKAAALRQALSDRARAGRIHVLSDFGMTETPSTKAAKAALQKVVENRHALIVLTPEVDDIVALSVNNLNEHHALFVGQLNTYDVLVNDDVVFSATALETFLRKEEN